MFFIFFKMWQELMRHETIVHNWRSQSLNLTSCSNTPDLRELKPGCHQKLVCNTKQRSELEKLTRQFGPRQRHTKDPKTPCEAKLTKCCIFVDQTLCRFDRRHLILSLYCRYLTGPAVSRPETARRQNSSTTSDATRDPTMASIPVTKRNWSIPKSPCLALIGLLLDLPLDVPSLFFSFQLQMTGTIM